MKDFKKDNTEEEIFPILKCKKKVTWRLRVTPKDLTLEIQNHKDRILSVTFH